MRKSGLILCILIFMAVNASAETVKLKNGRVFEGPIVEKSSDYIVIEFRGVNLKYHLDEIASISTMEDAESGEPGKENAKILFPMDTAEVLPITLNPPVEFDYKAKNEIYAMRKHYVAQYPELANALVKSGYAPSEDIFGQITDGKPWWGLLGLSYYGPGEKGIAGESEESRFLINPYLLVGLNEAHGYIVNDQKLPPIPIYPRPISLVWDKKRSLAKARYDVTSCWQKKRKYHISTEYNKGFELVAYNARDFGFKYLYIDPQKSTNIIGCPLMSGPQLIQQFIHCGGSCGYSGGCNNMSPSQPELLIKLLNAPALAYIKLWRDQPSSPAQPPDMVFVIEMI